MSKTVLLTRSKEDNEILRNILNLKGYACFDCSLIDHISGVFDVKILDDFTDIIITSKRAADLIPLAKDSKDAWVVGQVSADILSAKNYNIKYIASSANELKTILPEDRYNSIIYFAGNNISAKMPSSIKTIEIYKVYYKDRLSVDEIRLLKSGLDYILLYSENCAKALISLIVKNNLLKYLENSVVIAISSKVAKVVDGYFKNTLAASSARQILEELEHYDKKESIRTGSQAASCEYKT